MSVMVYLLDESRQVVGKGRLVGDGNVPREGENVWLNGAIVQVADVTWILDGVTQAYLTVLSIPAVRKMLDDVEKAGATDD